MKKKVKKIIISQRHTEMGNKGWIDYLENSYVKYLSQFGGIIFPLPNNTPKIQEFVDFIQPDGIVLCGGEDVSPILYGGKKKLSNNCSIIRDKTEERLLTYAITLKIPVLGICRGMQFLNVFFGGKVTQKIQEVQNSEFHVPVGKHELTITIPGKYQSGTVKKIHSTSVMVNSFHNQGVVRSELGKGLNGFAMVPNTEMVEGIYHERLPIAGIEWHPERTSYSSHLDSILINSFFTKKLFWNNSR